MTPLFSLFICFLSSAASSLLHRHSSLTYFVTGNYSSPVYNVYIEEEADDRVRRELDDALCRDRNEGDVCELYKGYICISGRCVSACALRNMRECRCAETSDSDCYLCCGNSYNACAPAHTYEIFKQNGEWYEKNECRWCRTSKTATNGAGCDDKDPNKMCLDGKCQGSLCAGRPEGSYCINTKNEKRICAEGYCEDPCERQNRRVCECPMMSRFRCTLCCYDERRRLCESALWTHGIRNKEGGAYLRVGLTCGRFDYTCNVYGRCRAGARSARILLVVLLLTFVVFC